MFRFKPFLTLFFSLFLVTLQPSFGIADSIYYQDKAMLNNKHQIIALSKMQKILDKLKSQVSVTTDEIQLNQLNDMTLELSNNADVFHQLLISKRQQIDAQLAVLGPAPELDNDVKEMPEVTGRRNVLENLKNKLNDQIKQSDSIKKNALVLSSQIVNLRRDQIKNQLALNSGSILGSSFWSPLISNQSLDCKKINEFFKELWSSISYSWTQNWLIGTVLWLIAAITIMIINFFYIENFLAWVSIHKVPEGRLRRSFLAVSISFTKPAALVLTFYFIALAFTRHNEVSTNVRNFIERLVELSVYCGLIASLGNAFLSIRRPSWRLSNISNEMALALQPFPPITAVLVFIFQTVEAFNYSVGTSLNTTIFANGLTALLISSSGLAISIFTNHVRRQILNKEGISEVRTTLVSFIQMILTITTSAILISLIIGYVTLARFLSYEVIWCGILLGAYYFLSHLINDVCETLFLTQTTTSNRMQISLNIDERHLQLAATLISAFGKMLLICFIALALLNSTFASSTPIELIQKIVEFWGGKGLESLNIVPAHMVTATFCLMVQVYMLRAIRYWLEKDFLPKTNMDVGMRVSLVTLFSNIGYVLIILLTLSIMGLQWSKLAWIVSALSVGIGFGLQEIVKNFISGLILLTERPVKVGDLVSISGIEGDIRRINVRATEIQLGDKSTVIVPNSHLISQNVRNATMGNAQGVVNIVMTFPLDVDLTRVREILLQVYQENERIQKTPEPSVFFKELSQNGIVLSITGNVINQRLIAGVKSDLLFAILMHLRKEGIVLSKPQQMVVIEDRGVQLTNINK